MSRALKVLVVEDEMMIALMIEDMLAEMGHEVAALAMRLPHGLDMARTAAFDLAILDVNLDGRRSYPIAEVLMDRGIPFFFATGYGSAGVDPPFKGRLTLKKPFLAQDLAQAIDKVAA